MANFIEQLTALVDSEASYNLQWPEIEPVEEFQR